MIVLYSKDEVIAVQDRSKIAKYFDNTGRDIDSYIEFTDVPDISVKISQTSSCNFTTK